MSGVFRAMAAFAPTMFMARRIVMVIVRGSVLGIVPGDVGPDLGAGLGCGAVVVEELLPGCGPATPGGTTALPLPDLGVTVVPPGAAMPAPGVATADGPFGDVPGVAVDGGEAP